MSVLKDTLATLLKNEEYHDVGIFDYSSSEDFNQLWSLAMVPEETIILWPSTPRDPSISPIDTTDCLSPLHWAVYWASRFGGGDTKPTLPSGRITILDLDPRENGKSPLIKLFRDLDADKIPWLRIIQACDLVVGRDAEEESVPPVDSSVEIEGAISSSPKVYDLIFPSYTDGQTETYLPNWDSRFEMLARAVREQLTSPGDPENRHAITNLVGPMILGANSGEGSDNQNVASHADHRLALKCVLHAAELLEDSAEELGSSEHFPVPPNLELVLIDDQALHGWDAWLESECNALLSAGPKFTVVSETETLLNWILRLTEELASDSGDPWTHDFRFKLGYSDEGSQFDKSDSEQILFLDLRLFAGRTPASEAAFYKAVLDLWQALLDRIEKVNAGIDSDQDERTLPWPDDISKAVTMLRQSIAAGMIDRSSGSDYIEAFTLLPRVLAQLDLSLPIVIFSSTTQAAALKKFENYGNIFTDFAKPAYFAGNLADFRANARHSISRALSGGLGTLTARRKCQALLVLSEGDNNPNLDHLNEDGDSVHVELYVDETGSWFEKQFFLGGLVAVFKDSVSARQGADEFDDSCVRNGLRYFEFPYLAPDTSSNVLLKHRDSGINELKAALSSAHSSPHLGFIRIKPTNQSVRKLDNSDLHDPKSHDNKFRQTLSALIELFVAEVIPSIIRESQPRQISMSFYIGTRLSFRPKNEPGYKGDIDFSYGIEIRKVGSPGREERGLRSFSQSDVYPIVADALLHHGEPEKDVERAIGVALVYKGEKKKSVEFVLDRPKREVHSFLHRRHIDLQPGFGVVKKITEYEGFIKVPDVKKDVYCRRDSWKGFEKARWGDYVRITKPKPNQRGTLECRVIETVENPPVLSDRFLQGTDRSDLRPDYRALHYVADQLTSNKETGLFGFNPLLEDVAKIGQFDEEFQWPLWEGIQASRLLDSGELGQAVSIFSFDRPNSERPFNTDLSQRPMARLQIGRRLGRELPLLTGGQFIQVATTSGGKSVKQSFDPLALLQNATSTQDSETQEDPEEDLESASPDIVFERLNADVTAEGIRALLEPDIEGSQVKSIMEEREPPNTRLMCVYLSGVTEDVVKRVKQRLTKRYWRVK